jgi:hypothetical protein
LTLHSGEIILRLPQTIGCTTGIGAAWLFVCATHIVVRLAKLVESLLSARRIALLRSAALRPTL